MTFYGIKLSLTSLLKTLLKKRCTGNIYRLTGNVPAFFEKIADNAIALNDYSDNQVEDLPIINEDEDDVGVDISDMEEF